jgi:hypothetical protein
MSGRQRGETGSRNVIAYAGSHALALRRTTAFSLPLCVAFLARGPHAQDTTSGYAQRLSAPFSVRALPLPLSCASSRVSGHVLVPRPPPIVTAGSNTRKAEVESVGMEGTIFWGYDVLATCACAFPRRLQ